MLLIIIYCICAKFHDFILLLGNYCLFQKSFQKSKLLLSNDQESFLPELRLGYVLYRALVFCNGHAEIVFITIVEANLNQVSRD